MKKLQERLELAKVVLREVSRDSCSMSVLETRVLVKAGSHSTFTSLFYFLRDSGFIVKSGSDHRAVNCISAKGRLLLEALV